MKLVIDLQVAQGASQHSEIGRNALAMTEALVRRGGDHEVLIALSGAFPDTIEALRATFDSLLPQEQIVVWEAPTPMAEMDPANGWRHKAGEILRETFLSGLKADMVYVPSLMQGYDDDVIVSGASRTDSPVTALALHDVVPFYEQAGLETNRKAWLESRLSFVRQAGLWLAPSEASRRQCASWLSLPSESVVNISMAAPEYLRPMRLSENRAPAVRHQYGVTRQFLLCAGSAASQEGLETLLKAYARLDEAVRRSYQVLVTGISRNEISLQLRQQMEQLGLAHDSIVVAPLVRNSDLCELYNLASAFCLPGLSSGFGMAGLEAMQCGTATVGANLPGISEIIGRSDALFDPRDERDLAGRLHQALTDEDYRRSLSGHGLTQAQKFTWRECASRTWDAFEAAYDRRNASQEGAERRGVSETPDLKRLRLAYVSPSLAEKEGHNRNSDLVAGLARHYEIDVVTDQPGGAPPWVEENGPIRSMGWFDKNAGQYDRILYDFGDPQAYAQIIDLALRHPGVIALHDCWRAETPEDQRPNDAHPQYPEEDLYYARGYTALSDEAQTIEASRLPWKHPIGVSVFRNAIGVICCTDETMKQARQYLGDHLADGWVVIPAESGSGETNCSIAPPERADRYFAAIESFARSSVEALRLRAVAAITAVDPDYESERDWLSAARAIAHNTPSSDRTRRILVDISELVQRDVGTGIQRVTRSILKELLTNPPNGYRVEPVYAYPNKPGYRYARKFTLRFLNRTTEHLDDAVVETRPGDIFLGLDLQRDVAAGQQDFYSSLRRIGGTVYFVIYDLLPIFLPHAFPKSTLEQHTRWLSVLARHSDGIICISRSVADELVEWLNANGAASRMRPLRIGWFHLGADIDMSVPTRGIPERGDEVLASLAARPSFLSVGTVEPRKGYVQLLKAFDQLWRDGADVNLTIVGKQGWNVDETAAALRGHPEFNKRLLWLDGISDEYLEKIYAASACLIAASEGEGFGLPLIEAARHRIPILARDIPVFHEVAGEHASYFAGREPGDLAGAVKAWLVLYRESRHPRSDEMPWLTWAQSAEGLKDLLVRRNWYASWPDERRPVGTQRTSEQDPSHHQVRTEARA
ncbi:glycosyltransferase family 4 protein [Microvirga yunnanensis]|uniref:glycosyltransferase family 4 protein n=1 Tax=Microvirga yunnanensis TaxID=2953740 RepID=UPI0021C9509D|nr:glycosyltransferase family 1 protein [Microvirga sp. HBU65207]